MRLDDERRDPMELGFAQDAEGNTVLNPQPNRLIANHLSARDALDEAQDFYRSARNTPGVDMGAASDRVAQARENLRQATDALASAPDPRSAASVPVHTQQTLDYVKRGMDDVLEQYRNPITNKLMLDEAGRAQNQVRQQFVGETDRLNPLYASARSAYAGPASAQSALQLGRESLNLSAEDLEAATGRMTPEQKSQFALGFRAAMADHLGRAVDGADKVGRLLGTPRKRAALASVFGGEEGFGRFLSTMADERATSETYRSLMSGSQTAERLAQDAHTGDHGLIEAATGAAIRGAAHPLSLLGNALQALRDLPRFGVGQAGNETREGVASLLTESDPAVLADLAKSIKRAQVRQGLRSRATHRLSASVGSGTGVSTVELLGSLGPSAQ